MFCIHCGKELDDGSKFCIHCGERLEEETAQTAVETVEEVKETVSEKIEEEKETAAETAEEVKDAVSEKVEEVRETAAETAEDATVIFSKKVEEVKETAAEAVQEVKDTVSEKAEEVKETVTETAQEVNEAVSEKVEEANETVAQNIAEAVETAPEAVAVEAPAGEKAIDVSALLKNKTVLIIAAAAVIVLILLIIIIAAAASSGSSSSALELKGAYYTYYDAGEQLVFYNGKQIKGTDLSSGARIEAMSVDGSKAVITDGSDALYYLTGDKVTKITDDFDSSYINMSADGSAVCYTFDDTLFIYKGGKSTKISDVENLLSPAVLSPNGDTVVYAEVDGSKISTYAWKGGKTIDLDAKIIPVAVSKGGGIIYGMDRSSKLCYIKKLKADSAESVKTLSSFIAASYDSTQIMFRSDNGVYYFDSSLKEAIKVSGSSVSIIYPEGSAGTMNDLRSFIGYSDGKIYSFKRKGQDFEKDSLVSSGLDCKLSADGKTLVYLLGDSLYKTSVSNTDKKTLLADEVETFDADKSLKNIYFRNSDDALRYADGKSKSGKKIIDDVGSFIVTPNGVCVFVDDDDELQYSAGGGDRKKANLEDVESISSRNGIVYVIADDEFYVSTDGKKFNKS